MGTIVSRLQPSGAAEITSVTGLFREGSLSSMIITTSPKDLNIDPSGAEEGVAGDGVCRWGEAVVFHAAHSWSERVDLGTVIRPVTYPFDQGQLALRRNCSFVQS